MLAPPLPPSPMMMGHHSPFANPRMGSSPPCNMMPLSLTPAQQAGKSTPRQLNSNNSVRFIRQLGAGAFGEVWKAEYRGKIVAAKITHCPMGFRPREISILRAAQGSHTVKLIAEERNTSKGTAIIMELCEGSLADQIKQADKTRQSSGIFLDQLADICEALKSLHAKSIVFGDLKPDNILVNKEGGMVFSDFGDARDGRSTQCSPQESGWGCPRYHAKPDVEKLEMSPKSDMWMLAQTAIHMWTREGATCNPSPLPESIPLRELLQRCFSVNPASRPTAEEMLREIKMASHGKASQNPQTRPRSGSLSNRQSEAQSIPRRGQPNHHRRSNSHDESLRIGGSAPSDNRLSLLREPKDDQGMSELMMRVKQCRHIKKTVGRAPVSTMTKWLLQ